MSRRLPEQEGPGEPGPFHGRCFCGAITFELAPPTEFVSHCHCESCRRSHGAAFVTWTSVPSSRFRLVTGETLTSYRSSPEVCWQFCGRCGSHLFYEATFTPGRIYVTVASITGSLDREPESHVSFEEAVGWFEGLEGLPRYRGKTAELMARPGPAS